MFDGDGFCDDLLNGFYAGTVVEVRKEKAGKVSVHTLITRDEFVGEGKSWHEATLLKPEDRGESTGEEDTLNGGERNKAEGECGRFVRDPSESPVGLATNTWDLRRCQ